MVKIVLDEEKLVSKKHKYRVEDIFLFKKKINQLKTKFYLLNKKSKKI